MQVGYTGGKIPHAKSKMDYCNFFKVKGNIGLIHHSNKLLVTS